MAATDITITGLYHLQGQTVTAVICGLDCGDYVVSSDGMKNGIPDTTVGGKIVVPIGSDPNGLLSGAYLKQFDVGPYDTVTYGDATTPISIFDGNSTGTFYVPVVIGFSYVTIGKTLRPATADEGKSPLGPLLAKTRRNHMFGAITLNAQGVQFGTGDLSQAVLAAFRDDGGNVLTMDTLFTGVHWDTIADDYSFEGGVGWMLTRPYPCTMTAIGGFMETAER